MIFLNDEEIATMGKKVIKIDKSRGEGYSMALRKFIGSLNGVAFIDIEEGQTAVGFDSDNNSGKVQPEDQAFTYLS